MESATSTLRKGEKKAGVLRFPEIICCVVWIVIKMVNMSSTAKWIWVQLLLCQDQVTKTEAFACWWRRSQRSGDSIYQSKFYTRGIMDAKYWGYQALKFWKVLKSNWREIPIQDNERHCGPSVIWPGRDKVALFSCRCYCYWGTLKHSLFGGISCTSLWRNSWRSISFQVKIRKFITFSKAGLESPAVVTAPMVKEKLKIREKLRKFFLRRPNVEDLMKRGIMKNEPVFGSTLMLLAR